MILDAWMRGFVNQSPLPPLPPPPHLPLLPPLPTSRSPLSILGNKLHSERDIGITATQSLSGTLTSIMGFVNLSLAEIAADYSVPLEKVLSVCDKLGIAYKNQQTRLPLEDAKAIISQLSETRLLVISDSVVKPKLPEGMSPPLTNG